MAAPGPSLEAVRCHLPIIVVQDAWRLMPWADVMYGCDERWWRHHKGTDFEGEKWSSHHVGGSIKDDKTEIQELYGLNLVKGEPGSTFSFDPELIRYGDNSGFQAINLALLFGCKRVLLIGFDMQRTGGKGHFFGEHPDGFGKPDYERFIKRFETAAKELPEDVEIINCTPGSALRCFPTMDLNDALLLDRTAA